MKVMNMPLRKLARRERAFNRKFPPVLPDTTVLTFSEETEYKSLMGSITKGQSEGKKLTKKKRE